MKRAFGAFVLALSLAGVVAEAANLPKATSFYFRLPQRTIVTDYVQRPTKYASYEWGSSMRRNLGPLPVRFHAYIKGRIGF